MPAGRYIEAAVYPGNADNLPRKRRHKVRDALGRAGLASPTSSGDEGNGGGGRRRRHRKRHSRGGVGFASFRWGSKGTFGDAPRRVYNAEDVGRLQDLVGDKRKIGGAVKLQVECLRPLDSVVTTVSSTAPGAGGGGGVGGWWHSALPNQPRGQKWNR